MNFRSNWLPGCATGLLVLATAGSVMAVIREVTVVRTNHTDRWITNNVEVTVPRNLIMDVLQTNFVPVHHTNIVHVYRTNYFEDFVTNRVVVRVTNTVPINITNYAQTWVTNTRNLWLTNLSTVVLLKTNWVTHTVTNLVEIDLPGSGAAASGNPAAAHSTAGLIVDVSFATAKSGQLSVSLKARDASGSAGLQIEGWKVQNDDGSIMSFGKTAEFRRELPPGRYQVEVTGKRVGSAPIKTKSTLVVGERQATIVPQPLAAK